MEDNEVIYRPPYINRRQWVYCGLHVVNILTKFEGLNDQFWRNFCLNFKLYFAILDV